MYSAKEAAEITGLSTATLRYYEKEKLLPPIARTTQKYRQYSDENIESQMSDLKNALALTQSKLMFYQEILKQPCGNNMTYLEEWHSFKNGGIGEK